MNNSKTGIKRAPIFLDGMTAGTRLEDQRICVRAVIRKSEVQTLRDAMEAVGAVFEKRTGYSYVVTGPHTSMVLSLRKRNNSSSYYLNLSGNPLTFLRPDNLGGYANPRKLITKCFRIAIKALEKESEIELPQRVKKEVGAGLINVHSLEFAAYTKPLDKRRYLATLQHVFSYGVRTPEGRKSVLSALGMRITQNYDGTSLGLGFYKPGTFVEDKMPLLYDKQALVGLEYPDYLEDRLRYDLHLCPPWFAARKIKTLVDLDNYMERHGEIQLLKAEIEDCIERACMNYMFTITRESLLAWGPGKPRPPGVRPDLSYEDHKLLWAALQMDVDQDFVASLLLEDDRRVLRTLKTQRTWIPKLRVETKVLK